MGFGGIELTTSSLQLSSQHLIGEMLKRASHKTPDREAFVYGETRLTHKEIDERATHLAGWFQGHGIGMNDKVGFLLKNSIAFAEVFYASVLAGGVGVPMNFRLAPEEIEYIVNNSDAKILIIDDDYKDTIKPIISRLEKVEKIVVVGLNDQSSEFVSYESIFEAELNYTPPEGLTDNAPAMIAYTSGTTGRPKGAVLTHKNLCQNSFNLIWEGNTRLFTRTLISIPLFHIGGLGSLVTNCLINGTSIIHRDFNPAEILRTIEKEKITTLGLVPSMWIFLFQVPNIEDFDLSSVTKCSTGAAIAPLELKKKIMKYFKNATLIEQFGQTETTSATVVLTGDDTLRKTASVGKSVINVEVRVVDEEMNDVPLGEVGEIVYRGPTVMKEYYKNPEATAEAFRGGWFHSGDLVRQDEEGFIYVVDRKKDMVISGGENIYPAEIEEVLYLHPDILECAVIGIPDEEWGESVKAYIALKPGKALNKDDIINHCMMHLASYKKPKIVEFIDALPRNAGGKVLKQVLRKSSSLNTN
jgi:fatty-acyl-CoA synthase